VIVIYGKKGWLLSWGFNPIAPVRISNEERRVTPYIVSELDFLIELPTNKK